MSVTDEIAVVWFRKDLRLADNPAWAAATSRHRYVVPLFIIDPRVMDAAGPFRRRQLIASLQALDYDLAEDLGGRLLVRTGLPEELVPEAVEVFQAGSVYLNADTSPFAARRDRLAGERLEVDVHAFNGNLVLPPGSVTTSKGQVPRVFSTFYKAWTETEWDPWPEPGQDMVVLDDPGEFVPRLDVAPPFFEGAGEARTRLATFQTKVDRYDTDSDRIDRDGTSQLSVDLHYGTMAARAVVSAIGDTTEARRAFVRQLAMRDWYAHLLVDGPSMVDQPFNDRYSAIEWLDGPSDIAAWKGGFTGYPIVDAAMRQLREQGWIHHKLRVIASSFLCKDLLVDWRIGERHFRHLLVDAEVSSNVGNWQWIAGTGADASPFNRVLNPVSQSRKVDPDGAYIRKWVPELGAIPDDVLHAPWEADDDVLEAAGVELGRSYPLPIVEHAAARERVLEVYAAATGDDSIDPEDSVDPDDSDAEEPTDGE